MVKCKYNRSCIKSPIGSLKIRNVGSLNQYTNGEKYVPTLYSLLLIICERV